MIALTLGKNLWPPTPKWINDSASRETKYHKQHAFLTFATQALEKGYLLIIKKTLWKWMGY